MAKAKECLPKQMKISSRRFEGDEASPLEGK